VDRAVILMNMGGASNLDEIEIFMRNMFNDHRIIGAPPFIRSRLSGYITASRLEEVRENYEKIGGGSPLLQITRSIQRKLQNRIDDAIVEVVMRYTPPFATDVLRTLKSRGVKKLFLIPMYPQFSTTTTASSIEDYDFEPYLSTVEDLIAKSVEDVDPSDINLVFSAHGLPVSVIKKGDPYQKQVEAEVKLHTERLKKMGLVFNQVHLAYQSKVGPMRLFELDIEYREVAEELGFEFYRVCRCPNDTDRFVEVLELLYRRM